MSESVCVLGSKSHSGCLPIIMMLLNPSLKLTLLSFSLVLYPPFPPPPFSLSISLSHSLFTPLAPLSHFLNAQLTTPNAQSLSFSPLLHYYCVWLSPGSAEAIS